MGLCMKVFGKSDKDWVTLMLWTDDNCPEFCLICLLLVYVYVSQIKGAFLFLSKVELNNPPSDGIFVTQVSGGVMRECVASLVKDVLGLSGETFKVGLHLLQKTAYLFGIWGNAEVATLAKSAQHKCIDTANNYACDATLIKVHTTIQNNDLNRVKQWKPILLTSPLSAALFNVQSIPFSCIVVELAIASLFITYRYYLLTCVQPVLHFYATRHSSLYNLSKLQRELLNF